MLRTDPGRSVTEGARLGSPSVAAEAVERGKQVAHDVAEQATQTARESGREHAHGMAQDARQAGEQARKGLQRRLSDPGPRLTPRRAAARRCADGRMAAPLGPSPTPQPEPIARARPHTGSTPTQWPTTSSSR